MINILLALPLDILWLLGFKKIVQRFASWRLARTMRKTIVALNRFGSSAAEADSAFRTLGQALNN